MWWTWTTMSWLEAAAWATYIAKMRPRRISPSLLGLAMLPGTAMQRENPHRSRAQKDFLHDKPCRCSCFPFVKEFHRKNYATKREDNLHQLNFDNVFAGPSSWKANQDSHSTSHRQKFRSGLELLRDPRYNKGTEFSEKERDTHYLHGLLPPVIVSQDLQIQHILQNVHLYENGLEKYVEVMDLQERNERLFYKLLIEHVEELLPIVYTPNVGEACQKFGSIFRRLKGLYISLKDKSCARLFEELAGAERASHCCDRRRTNSGARLSGSPGKTTIIHKRITHVVTVIIIVVYVCILSIGMSLYSLHRRNSMKLAPIVTTHNKGTGAVLSHSRN